MSTFNFLAVNAKGENKKGTIEADSVRSARDLLRKQLLIPIEVSALTTQGDKHWGQREVSGWLTKNPFSPVEVCIFTRQLAGLVSSGLTLDRALSTLSEESEKETQRVLLSSIRDEVSAGSSFGSSLEKFSHQFSNIYIGVIKAGEESGNLGLVLLRLADELEERQELKGKFIQASLYPAIVCVVAITIVLFLISYVVPQVAQVFTSSKRSLPILTRFMLGFSDFIRTYGWAVLLLSVMILAAVKLALRQAVFRRNFDAAFLRLPILGKLSKSYNTASFASTLSMLIEAGVPMLKALQSAADTLSNQAIRSDALEIIVLVREGAPLGVALFQKKRFSSLLTMFTRLGEQTGQLPSMLNRASKQLNTEVSRRAMQLSTLLEPLLIVFMGLIVMLIVLAILMPIIELNQLVQ